MFPWKITKPRSYSHSIPKPEKTNKRFCLPESMFGRNFIVLSPRNLPVCGWRGMWERQVETSHMTGLLHVLDNGSVASFASVTLAGASGSIPQVGHSGLTWPDDKVSWYGQAWISKVWTSKILVWFLSRAMGPCLSPFSGSVWTSKRRKQFKETGKTDRSNKFQRATRTTSWVVFNQYPLHT